MDNTIIVAVLSFAGTVLGSLFGVLASAKLTNYRIEQLEKKVDKHNNFAERIPVLEEKIKSEEHRIEDLEKYHQPN
jgi:ABC-type lipoprotein release transport system permease subunit